MRQINRQKQFGKIRQACVETIEGQLLLSVGVIDGTFGIDGVAEFQAQPFQEGVGFTVQRDGSISLPVGNKVFHLSSNGDFVNATPVPSAPTPLQLDEDQGSFAVQSDGKVVVAPSTSLFATVVVVKRYNADGTLDTTYGTNGSVSMSTPQFSGEWTGTVAIDSQGRAIIGMGVGTPGIYAGGYDAFAVARLTSSGQIDKSFGTDGFTVGVECNDDVICTALAIAPDGTIYQAGALDQFDGDEDPPIVAYSSSGQFLASDTAIASGIDGGLQALAIEPDGRVVATGYIDNPSLVVVERFLPADEGFLPDNSFGYSGETTFNVLDTTTTYEGDSNVGWQVAIQPGGGILVGSSATNYENTYSEVTITRLSGDSDTSISGTIYSDVNGDGKRESGEGGVAGQFVYDDLDNSGAFQSGDPTTTTDSSGNYVLKGVPYGAAIIREIPKPGEQQTYPTNGYGEHVTVGQTAITGANFGVRPSPKLSGTVIGMGGSYRNHGTTIANVFDGNLSTYFDGPDASGNWAGLDLGVAKVITQLSYAPRSGWESRMVGGMFQGSNSADFSSGNVTLYTVTSVPKAGVLTTVPINNPSAFRYVRYIGPANSYCDIAEAQFFGGTPLVGATLYPDGLLVVNGTAGADSIHVALDTPYMDMAAVTIDGVTQDFAAGPLNLVVNAGAGNDTVLVDGFADSTEPNGVGVTVNGGDGNDSLTSAFQSPGGQIYLDGGGGDDYLNVESDGIATLIGGDGNDIFDSSGSGRGVQENVYGGDGNDTLRADGEASYVIYDGGAGSNTIDYAYRADSTQFGYNYTLDMTGGFLVNVNNVIGGPTLTGVVANDAGDTITYASAPNGVTITGGAGNDVISITGGNGVQVNGNGGDDNITVAQSSNVTVNGGAGNDTINVRGNLTPSSVDGGPGFDTAYTGPGDTVVNVESLNPDTLTPFTGTVIGTPGSYRNHSTTITNAFDGNLSSFFDGLDASGDWAGLDLGAAKVVTQVKYAPRPGWESRMVGGEIQASNTANFSSGVVTLFTINSTPVAGELTTASLSNNSAFRYYRYVGPANSYCDIAELEFDG